MRPRLEARRDESDRVALVLPGDPEPIAPTHWSFGQLAGLVGAFNGDGAEIGRHGVVADGRRFAALQMLIKAKRLAKNRLSPPALRSVGGSPIFDS